MLLVYAFVNRQEKRPESLIKFINESPHILLTRVTSSEGTM